MAGKDTRIRLYAKPRSITPDAVFDQPVTSLLVTGIVNPFGPTLTAVVIAGQPARGAKFPVAEVMLNPFSQGLQAVGEIAFGEDWLPSEVISRVVGLRSGCCPTLLLPSASLAEETSLALHAEHIRGFEGAREVYDRVKNYYGNPWDRVSEEIAAGPELMRLHAAGQRLPAPEPLGAGEAEELAGLLLSEQHLKPELRAFFYAWAGSIQHTAPGLASLKPEAFATAFDHLAASCRLPELSVEQAEPGGPADRPRE
jgi:hypothetical protein